MLVSRSLPLPGARRGSAVAAALIATVVLAGCAGSTTSSKQTKTLTGDEAAVQNVIADVADRAADTDAGGICREDLSATAQATFAKVAGTCSKGVLKAIDTADALQMDVTSVKITSTGTAQVAVAQVDTPDDIGTRAVVLGRASKTDKWKIVTFDPTLSKKVSKDQTATPQSTLPLTSP